MEKKILLSEAELPASPTRALDLIGLVGVGPQRTFTYDGAGNTRTALRTATGDPEYEWTWDAFNMQTRTRRNRDDGTTQQWVYVYGPGDYRLWTEDYTRDEVVFDWKFRGPDGRILQEYEVRDLGGTWTHVRDVIHGAEGPLAARYADGSERYFHTDHLGTPRVITKADGTKLSEHHYYPYGLEVPIEQEDPVPEGFLFEDGFETGDTSRWATPGSPQPPPEGPPPEELSVKYTGHERDLHRSTDYMLARSYAFLLGRFLSVDPVQDGWSRYGYARNNPIGAKDPDGRKAFVLTVGPGQGLFEAFGRSAVFVASASGERAGVSLGGNRGFEDGLGGFIEGYLGEGRDVRVQVLNTSQEQDAAMIDFLSDPKQGAPDGGTDETAAGAGLMIRENCAQASCNTLEAGGVLEGNASQVFGGAVSLPLKLTLEVMGSELLVGDYLFEPGDEEAVELVETALGER